MLARVTWLARVVAVIAIGLLTFLGTVPTGADLTAEIAAYTIGLLAVAYWLAGEVRPAVARRPSLAWAAIAATGVAQAAPQGGAFIGFSFMAALAAGTDPSWLSGVVIAAIAVLAVESSNLIWSSGTASVLGFPLLLAVAYISGRNRRAYQMQARTSALLSAQLEVLRAEQKRVAVLDERTRIAREIHDVLAHSLGALGIQIQSARAVLADRDDRDQALSLLERAQRMASDGLADTRRAVHALRGDPTRLDGQIAELARAHTELHHTDVDFRIEGAPATLTAETTVALARTAQEALVNSAKHAPLQPIRVRLGYDEQAVHLRITNPVDDDLAGPPRAPEPGVAPFSTLNGGYGLTGMRERLLLISGSLHTRFEDGGWIVEATVPR
jgi:signal transduction histidine kinase